MGTQEQGARKIHPVARFSGLRQQTSQMLSSHGSGLTLRNTCLDRGQGSVLEVLSDCYKVSMLGSLPGDYNVICFRCGPGICWGKQLRTKPSSALYFNYHLMSPTVDQD